MKSVYRYRRGNHSECHVRAFGSLLFAGSNRSADKFVADMRRRCRAMWYESCTSLNRSDFIAYEMSDVFVYYD